MNQKKGTLNKGQFADLAVLSDDYLNCADEHIRRIESLLTVCDGMLSFTASHPRGSTQWARPPRWCR